MDLITIIILAIGLSADAFSVAVTDGILIRCHLRKRDAAKIALFFGFFQFMMPVIGWAVSFYFREYLQRAAGFVGGGLIIAIGILVLIENIKQVPAEESLMCKNPLDFKVLSLMAIATSIDALAVGVSFASLDVNVLGASSIIGVVTFLLCFAGVYIGRGCGDLFRHKAGMVGGGILILLGIKIIIETII